MQNANVMPDDKMIVYFCLFTQKLVNHFPPKIGRAMKKNDESKKECRTVGQVGKCIFADSDASKKLIKYKKLN